MRDNQERLRMKKWGSRSRYILLLLACCGLMAPAAFGQAQAGKFYILGQNDVSMCFQRQDPNWDNGNPVHVWKCSEGTEDSKLWVFESAEADGGPKGSFYIKSAGNRDVCIHRKFPNWDNGNPLHLWNCAEGPMENKTWAFHKKQGTSTQLAAAYDPSTCVHKTYDHWENGNPLHLWDCDAEMLPNEQWMLTAPPEDSVWFMMS